MPKVDFLHIFCPQFFLQKDLSLNFFRNDEQSCERGKMSTPRAYRSNEIQSARRTLAMTRAGELN